MPYQKKTMRRMPLQTKKLAMIINETEKQLRALKRLLVEVERVERDSIALMRSANGHHAKDVKIQNGKVYMNWPRCPEHDQDMVVTANDCFACLECPEESRAAAAIKEIALNLGLSDQEQREANLYRLGLVGPSGLCDLCGNYSSEEGGVHLGCANYEQALVEDRASD